jgi:hypothetical protein
MTTNASSNGSPTGTPIVTSKPEVTGLESERRSRCEHCAEEFTPGEGRDGYCFTCSVHLTCPCRDEG